ncbi:hypothetical protein ACFLRC_00235 [Candidatus Altiarchaeota archaeon]
MPPEKKNNEADLDDIKKQWQKKLEELEEREKQLLKFDDMLRQREQEWKQRVEGEEERIREEQRKRDEELRKREEELGDKEEPAETQELLEVQKRLEQRQEEIQQRQEELDRRKQVLETGEEKQTEDAYNRLKEEMKDLGDDAIVLISSRAEGHMRMVLAALAILLNERIQGGIYISVSRPFRYIMNSLEENNIELSHLMAIDCVSQMTGKAGEKKENIVYVENPSSLEEISMYIDRLLVKIENPKKFILLDSLSSILIYNNAKSVKEFTHFMINKMRLEGMGGVILSIEKKEAQDLIQTIKPMLDKEIRI